MEPSLASRLHIDRAGRLTAKEVEKQHFLENGECPEKLSRDRIDHPPEVAVHHHRSTATDHDHDRRKRRHELSVKSKDNRDHKKPKGERREGDGSKKGRKDGRRDHHQLKRENFGRHEKDAALRAYRRK
ncbi:hypothetical protein BGX23_005421 [Mortierella sp. AD031]|nr:hypothetical protein BGX23_005421 [Mortierella sp. AD031]KAG0208741.1 hypothetical protein BGX33_006065 [Mortierella sp. NVP41]